MSVPLGSSLIYLIPVKCIKIWAVCYSPRKLIHTLFDLELQDAQTCHKSKLTQSIIQYPCKPFLSSRKIVCNPIYLLTICKAHKTIDHLTSMIVSFSSFMQCQSSLFYPLSCPSIIIFYILSKFLLPSLLCSSFSDFFLLAQPMFNYFPHYITLQ